jgi:hypothetical protein
LLKLLTIKKFGVNSPNNGKTTKFADYFEQNFDYQLLKQENYFMPNADEQLLEKAEQGDQIGRIFVNRTAIVHFGKFFNSGFHFSPAARLVTYKLCKFL